MIAAVSALLICGAGCVTLPVHAFASDTGASEPWCGQDQSVTACRLSEREVEVSLATLAALRHLAGAKPLSQAQTSSGRQGSIGGNCP
jgi:hypothetical protein